MVSPRKLGGLAELVALFPRLVLFIGNGPKYQYRDVDQVLSDLQPHLQRLNNELGAGRWTAVFGGDTFVPSQPDLGVVMERIKADYTVPLCAVVGWDQIDPHVDHFIRYQSQTCAVTGRELYGGWDEDGTPVGGTAVYLSKDWQAYTHAVIALSPVGFVGSQEQDFVEKNTTLTLTRIQAPPLYQPTKKLSDIAPVYL